MGEARQQRACNRKERRFVVSRADEAWIEIASADGRSHRLPLLEISGGGLKFGLDGCANEPPRGATIRDVNIRVGDIEFRAMLRVCHVTHSFSSGSTCGAQLRVMTETDRSRLTELLRTLAANRLPSRRGSPAGPR